MPKAAEYVHYNNGSSLEFALVTGANAEDGHTLNLLVADVNGAWQVEANVPHREPEDYDAGGGGGRTWCEPA